MKSDSGIENYRSSVPCTRPGTPAAPDPDDDSERASVHADILGREDEAQLLSFTPGFARRLAAHRSRRARGARRGQVRRWHVYDYTIAAVTIAGAEPAELTIPDRQRS